LKKLKKFSKRKKMSALPKKPVVPASKPANLKFVRAQLCYQAQEPDELSFEEGDLVTKDIPFKE
jgi:hypothetical protein